jgi:PAS domain S-box-containing protein
MIKILIADDKPENLYLLQSLLEMNGYKTISARNGAEALGVMKAEIPDLIITDILMPVMDGFVLCKECKKDKSLKDIPFFFYTATYTDSKDEEFALGLGADRFILKPQEPDDFMKIIDNFLEDIAHKKIKPRTIIEHSENVVLKEYNEVLVRKLEDKMLQSEKTEKELRNYTDKLENEIRERKKIEDSLRESRLLFQTLAEASPVGIFRTTLDGETTYVNPKWCELSGLSEQKALGKGWMKAVHPDDRGMLSIKWSTDTKERHESTSEYRFLRPDGSIIWVLGKAVPEMTENSILGYVGTITDITERKLSETKLKNSEERLKILFEYAPDAYYLSDLKGTFIDGNIAAEKLLGYSRSELIGKSFLKLEILQAQDIPKAAKLLVKNSLGFATGPETFTLKSKDGSEIVVEIITHPITIEGKSLVLGVARDISERVKSEEALIESESKYRHLVTNSPDGIFIVDNSGKFLSANRAICEVLGYTEDELISLHLLDIIPEKYHPVHLERQSLVVKGELNTSLAEYEVIGKKGKTYFVEVLSVPYYRNKEIIGFQGIARNITERKKMETKLRESEARFKGYFNTSLAGIAITSPEAGWIDVNDRVCEMLGYPKEEMLKMKWTDITYSEDLDIDLDQFKKVLNGEIEGYNLDKRFNTKNGQTIWTSMAVNCLRNGDGKVQYLITVLIDITSRKLTEEALLNSQQLLTNALKLAGMGAWEFDVNKDEFTFNDLFYKIYNTSLEIVGGYKMSSEDYSRQFVFPDDSQIVKKEIIKSLETTDPSYSLQVEHRSLLPNGDAGYVNVRFSLIKDKAGKTVRLIGVNQDITGQKKNEFDLMRAKEKAEESDKLKTAFLHNISHEIRTPLNAIVGFSALLTEPGLDKDSLLSFIDTITQSSNQLLAIINDIIEISNIDAGIVKLSKSEIQINMVFERLFDQFFPVASERSLSLRKKTPLPANEAIIQADNTKFIQVLSNLVGNALKFTSNGTIEFGYDLTNGFLKFYVSDTGIGIPEDQYQRIFDRFYQVEHMMARHFEGTGLGLSISKAFVEIMGGKIWVESELGKGSVFYFTLPYNKPEIKVPKPSINNTDKIFDIRASILVAEDDENNYNLIKKYLAFPNITLFRAKNGVEAVNCCESGQYLDLVLMDLKMPEMDGYEATKKIKELRPSLSIIAQTAFITDNEKAYKSGCVDIITKPFNRRSLLEIIEKYLKD